MNRAIPSETIPPYCKDPHFETVLTALNTALRPVELECIRQIGEPQLPIILIAGTQRSGTTLLMQLLVTSFQVGYVSNLAARFWQAPYIGTLLSKELRQKQRPNSPDFTSELGTTYGYEGPHEFGYFWQHWFPYNETHQTSIEDLGKMDTSLFRQELAAMESVFSAPLAFKNPIAFSLNMNALARILPTSVFIVCRREPIYVAQSTLQSRIRYHGDREKWFSVKPKEYPWLKDLPYPDQIAGQIHFTEKRLSESLSKLRPHRYLIVEYQELCRNPMGQMEAIQALVSQSGFELSRTGFEAPPFRHTNRQQIDDDEFRSLQDSLESFYGSPGR